MRASRLIEIEKYIRDKRSVSITELCDVFKISINTARRDIAEIVSKTDLEKTYGGVSVAQNQLPPSFKERTKVNLKVKERLGRAAAKLVQDGEVIFVDGGTTTCHLIDYLAQKENVTIITHSIDVITRAFAYPNLDVIVIAGKLNRQTFSFTNQIGNVLEKYNISKAFMATTGLTLENGATQVVDFERAIKTEAVNKSDRVIFMLESEKVGKVCLYTTCEAKNINTIIIDKMPDDAFVEGFSKLGGSIIQA